MADIIYGINRGETEFDIITDTSDQGDDVNIQIDDSKGITKSELLIMLDMFKNHIIKQADFT